MVVKFVLGIFPLFIAIIIIILARRRQIKNRTTLCATDFTPFNLRDTRRYIQYRLETTNLKGSNLFHPKAIKEIYRSSKGYPRLIEEMCDYALMAYERNARRITKENIQEIVKDMETHHAAEGQVTYIKQVIKKPRRLREGGDKKMKLQATYSKNANGSIEVTIKVVDQGAFPTVNIFNSASENPSDEAWNLAEGKQSTISKTLPSSDEAKQWVSSQVKALKEKLDYWRNIVVPESEEFDV